MARAFGEFQREPTKDRRVGVKPYPFDAAHSQSASA